MGTITIALAFFKKKNRPVFLESLNKIQKTLWAAMELRLPHWHLQLSELF